MQPPCVRVRSQQMTNRLNRTLDDVANTICDGFILFGAAVLAIFIIIAFCIGAFIAAITAITTMGSEIS